MRWPLLLCLTTFSLHAQLTEAGAQAVAELKAFVQTAEPLKLQRTFLSLSAPSQDWALGMVSSLAVDNKGLVYILQRGDKADPVIVADREVHILRSWGKGLYKIPHSIRIDPQGNVWTVDAQSSAVLKFTPEGKIADADRCRRPA
jgi:hypothetical protein